VFDASDEDVRHVFLRAVVHRVRVRDGPRDEIMADLAFATPRGVGEDLQWASGRRSVKEIMKEILDTI